MPRSAEIKPFILEICDILHNILPPPPLPSLNLFFLFFFFNRIMVAVVNVYGLCRAFAFTCVRVDERKKKKK